MRGAKPHPLDRAKDRSGRISLKNSEAALQALSKAVPRRRFVSRGRCNAIPAVCSSASNSRIFSSRCPSWRWFDSIPSFSTKSAAYGRKRCQERLARLQVVFRPRSGLEQSCGPPGDGPCLAVMFLGGSTKPSCDDQLPIDQLGRPPQGAWRQSAAGSPALASRIGGTSQASVRCQASSVSRLS